MPSTARKCGKSSFQKKSAMLPTRHNNGESLRMEEVPFGLRFLQENGL